MLTDPVKEYSEIIFERDDKIAKITMNRPEKHNAFTPVTVAEMIDAFNICRDDSTIGVIILTGAGDKAFSSGGDQSVRVTGLRGPRPHRPAQRFGPPTLDSDHPQAGDCHGQGLVSRGGNVLQLVCDLTIAADNAIFGQTGPKVGSLTPVMARVT